MHAQLVLYGGATIPDLRNARPLAVAALLRSLYCMGEGRRSSLCLHVEMPMEIDFQSIERTVGLAGDTGSAAGEIAKAGQITKC